MSLIDGVAWEKEHGYEKPKKAKKEKPNYCCICTTTKDLDPYLGTKWRCAICKKEGRHIASSK